jgi:hypothetical protein
LARDRRAGGSRALATVYFFRGGREVVLIPTVDKLLVRFRRAFSREATFEWFVLIVFAMLFRLEAAGVTSFVRALGLSPLEYRNLLHFFHSSATSTRMLSEIWVEIALELAPAVRLRGRPVMLADSIKVAKEGRKMPAVKWLHQESENNTKPPFIRGHYWGGLALLARRGTQLFGLPIRFEIQDGIKKSPSEKVSLVGKMAWMIQAVLSEASYVISDAYFPSRKFIATLLQAGHHLIARVRSTTVGHRPYEAKASPRKRRRGRPKKSAKKVVLQDLFERSYLFTTAKKLLYIERRVASYYAIDLFWNRVPSLARFVLTVYDNGARRILLSTDASLSPEDIIEAYSWRFKIEVSFKTMVRLVGAFAYHFWLMAMAPSRRKAKDMYLHRATPQMRRSVERKIEAYERFVTIGALAVGLLQLLSLNHADHIRDLFPIWLRTFPKSTFPTELVVRSALQNELCGISARSADSLLVTKILRRKRRAPSAPTPMRLPA